MLRRSQLGTTCDDLRFGPPTPAAARKECMVGSGQDSARPRRSSPNALARSTLFVRGAIRADQLLGPLATGSHGTYGTRQQEGFGHEDTVQAMVRYIGSAQSSSLTQHRQEPALGPSPLSPPSNNSYQRMPRAAPGLISWKLHRESTWCPADHPAGGGLSFVGIEERLSSTGLG